MAQAALWRRAAARSFALTLLVCQLQPSHALRSLAAGRSEDRVHRRTGRSLQQLDRESITLGGGRDVWLVDGEPEALPASNTAGPAAGAPAARLQAALLQQSSGDRRQLPSLGSESEEPDDRQGFGNVLEGGGEESEGKQNLYSILGAIVPVLMSALEVAGVSDEDILAFNQELDPENLEAAGPGALAAALGHAMKAIDPARLKEAAPELALTLVGTLKALGPEKLKAAGPELLGVLGSMMKGISPEKWQAAGGNISSAVGGALKAAAKFDDVDRQVEVLEAFMKLSGWVTETAKVAAQQLNSSITDSSSRADAAAGLQALLAAGASTMRFYGDSIGSLQQTLMNASGGIMAYTPRYGWMDNWKTGVQGIGQYYQNSSQIVGYLGTAPEALSAQLCPFLETALPTLHNMSLMYVGYLGQVVSMAHQNTTLVESEPVKTGIRMITTAMSTVKVEGLFLEEDGLTEQVCRSAVFAANRKLGCKLQLPWVGPVAEPPELVLSKEDEEKLKQAAKELEKMRKQGPFMASRHMGLVWTVLIVCGVLMIVAMWMCLQLPFALLLAPFGIVLHIVKGVVEGVLGVTFGILGLVFKILAGIIGLTLKILSFPVKCCCGWKSEEDVKEAMKESQASGIPTDVLDKMPLQERIVQKGSDLAKAVLEGSPTQGPFAQGAAPLPTPPPGAEDDAPEATAPRPQQGMEHPMYAKLGLNPVAALRKQYERKK